MESSFEGAGRRARGADGVLAAALTLPWSYDRGDCEDATCAPPPAPCSLFHVQQIEKLLLRRAELRRRLQRDVAVLEEGHVDAVEDPRRPRRQDVDRVGEVHRL